MRRNRNAKIVATLGPASSTSEMIEKLFIAGVDVFRLNFSHGEYADHQARYQCIRKLEKRYERPIAVLLDLQGPKLRIGAFVQGSVQLVSGQRFTLMRNPCVGDEHQVSLPHPEIFAALMTHETAYTDLLLDDGRIRLRVEESSADLAITTVINGGKLSDRKGVNVPGVLLPLSALTKKDREDLVFGLSLGVDWVALSFVQRPEDVQEIKQFIRERGGHAGVIAKIEKPSAVGQLNAIIEEADAVMVARGDLGVELPAEQVPAIQKRMVRECRKAGKPVIVATQMLESMVSAPVPTRAEASDVATAIYDGADAVMLSAESAAGQYPEASVMMMDRIIREVERDPLQREMLNDTHTPEQPHIADAICGALRGVAELLTIAATVTYTTSGYSTLRAARERPATPILSITPNEKTARKMGLVWGVHSVLEADVGNVDEMIDHARSAAIKHEFAKVGDKIIIIAGMPFGNSGNTNLLHIVKA